MSTNQRLSKETSMDICFMLSSPYEDAEQVGNRSLLHCLDRLVLAEGEIPVADVLVTVEELRSMGMSQLADDLMRYCALEKDQAADPELTIAPPPPAETAPVQEDVVEMSPQEALACATIQFRVVPCDDALKDHYSELLKSGIDMGPATIIDCGKNGRVLPDGRHRLEAAKAIGRPSYPVKIVKGETLKDAIEMGIKHNAKRGRDLSRDDLKLNLKNLLHCDSKVSDRKLGDLLGLSPTTVGKYRAELMAAAPGLPVVSVRVGRDNKARRIPDREDGDAVKSGVLSSVDSSPIAASHEDKSERKARSVARATKSYGRMKKQLSRLVETAQQLGDVQLTRMINDIVSYLDGRVESVTGNGESISAAPEAA